MKGRKRLDLVAQVWAGVDQEPFRRVSADRKLGLRSGFTWKFSLAEPPAIGAATVPLRKASSGRRTENLNQHPLEFWIAVRINLAAN